MSSATFSPCRLFRYTLTREWLTGSGTCVFIGLNPSVADEVKDDNTIRRCIAYSKAWGFQRYVMTNVFGWRSTDPLALYQRRAQQLDIVGPENDSAIIREVSAAGLVVACWGANLDTDQLGWREVDILRLLDGVAPLHCLGVTKGGSPKHPLYLSRNEVPRTFSPI
jgi:hypothetical protein